METSQPLSTIEGGSNVAGIYFTLRHSKWIRHLQRAFIGIDGFPVGFPIAGNNKTNISVTALLRCLTRNLRVKSFSYLPNSQPLAKMNEVEAHRLV